MNEEKRYLVILKGGGDTEIGLVTQAQWDWIHSPIPDEGYSGGFWTEKDPEDDHECEITIGSYENDRAIQANSTQFGSIAAARQFAGKHGFTISGDQYHGCLY